MSLYIRQKKYETVDRNQIDVARIFILFGFVPINVLEEIDDETACMEGSSVFNPSRDVVGITGHNAARFITYGQIHLSGNYRSPLCSMMVPGNNTYRLNVKEYKLMICTLQ